MMDPLIKKLQYKLQDHVLIMHSPEEFDPVLKEFKRLAAVDELPAKGRTYPFVIVFVKTGKEVDEAVKNCMSHLDPDAVLWMIYPKKSSKKYKATITRDKGWGSLGELGYEGVTMVAVDDDWSALRFRKVDFIKTMKRRESMLLSKEAKERRSGD